MNRQPKVMLHCCRNYLCRLYMFVKISDHTSFQGPNLSVTVYIPAPGFDPYFVLLLTGLNQKAGRRNDLVV
jgi:hypothetical protein